MQNTQDMSALVCAAIEDELGGLRRLQDVPAVEIEEMAARIVRAIGPLVGLADEAGAESRAA